MQRILRRKVAEDVANNGAKMIGFLLWSTFDIVGKVLIGIALVMVYKHLIRKQKLDKTILKAMKREQIIAVVGINFLILGYFVQILIALN